MTTQEVKQRRCVARLSVCTPSLWHTCRPSRLLLSVHRMAQCTAAQEEDEDALLRMMASMAASQKKSPARAAQEDDDISAETERATEAAMTRVAVGQDQPAGAHAIDNLDAPTAPLMPPSTSANPITDDGSCAPAGHASSRGKPKPAQNPRKKQRDPEAAARAAEVRAACRARDSIRCW